MSTFQVFDTASQKLVATMVDRDLECAIKDARNQARLFNRDPEAIFEGDGYSLYSEAKSSKITDDVGAVIGLAGEEISLAA